MINDYKMSNYYNYGDTYSFIHWELMELSA